VLCYLSARLSFDLNKEITDKKIDMADFSVDADWRRRQFGVILYGKESWQLRWIT